MPRFGPSEGGIRVARNGSKGPILGISCLHYEWANLAEAFRRCAEEFRFDLLELSTTKVRPEQYAEVRRLKEEHRLELGLHVWVDLPALGKELGTASALDILDTCARMHVRYVVVHMGRHPVREKGLAILRDILEGVAPVCADHGIEICLENHYAYEYRNLNELGGTPDEVLSVLEGLPPETFGFCLDYGHSHMTKNTSEFLQRVGDRLLYTHLADNLGEHDDHLSYGQGTVPWNEVLQETAELGFKGPYVVEFPEKQGPEHIDRCVAHLKRLVS